MVYFIVENTHKKGTMSKGDFGEKTTDEDPHRRLFGRIDYKIWRHHLERHSKTENKISERTYQKRVKMYEKKRIIKI